MACKREWSCSLTAIVSSLSKRAVDWLSRLLQLKGGSDLSPSSSEYGPIAANCPQFCPQMKEEACELALQAASEVEMRERNIPLLNLGRFFHLSVIANLFQRSFLAIFLDRSQKFWNGYTKEPAQDVWTF